MSLDPASLAREIAHALSTGTPIATLPSARDASFNVSAGYAVDAALLALARSRGRTPVGRKVGFANKAVWRALKLETLTWNPIYEDTVLTAPQGRTQLALGRRVAPRIEPEIVFKLKSALTGTADAAEALAAVEWIALGFEILDCPYPDWKFQPADFVAAAGLHVTLVVGPTVHVTPAGIPTLVEALAAFPLRLVRDGELVEQGSGRNVLKSPALCLGELAAAVVRHPGASPLAAGEIITTGTLTAAQPIAAGQIWRAEADELGVPTLTLAIAHQSQMEAGSSDPAPRRV